MKYTLTKKDKQQAEEIAQLRNLKENVLGKGDTWKPDTSSHGIHYIGLLGEIAVANILGTLIDTTFNWGDDSDLKIGPLSTEVKFRTKRGYDFALKNNNLNSFKADIGILAWPAKEQDTIEIIGWTTRVHFWIHHEKDDFGYGPRLVLRHNKMLLPNRLSLIFSQI